MSHIHLTEDQKATLRGLINEQNLRDVILTVAGIVAHDVKDLAKAIEAGELIRKAAVVISKP